MVGDAGEALSTATDGCVHGYQVRNALVVRNGTVGLEGVRFTSRKSVGMREWIRFLAVGSFERARILDDGATGGGGYAAGGLGLGRALVGADTTSDWVDPGLRVA